MTQAAVPGRSAGSRLGLDPATRRALWQQVGDAMERYRAELPGRPVTRSPAPEEVRALLATLDLDRPLSPSEAVDFVRHGLDGFQVQVAHPRYFGLFNPTPTAMGIAGDALAAAWNPQLAAWSHNPFAVEVEQWVLRQIGGRFGYGSSMCGAFASGGAEANTTSVLAALAARFPEVALDGIRATTGLPVLYVSSESHHSFVKAARIAGLGTRAVRQVPVDDGLRMRPDLLVRQIAADRTSGHLPFLVVATAGTTSAGIVDPIPALADVAEQEGLWLHADAAWGGGAAFVPELREELAGIERADSITFDAHKWLSAPMGAGIFLSRHPDILGRTFSTPTAYMPGAGHSAVVEPYHTSMQWSRRFIGLKVFLSLLVAGWEGFADAMGHQARMGDALRERLEDAGWPVVNRTRLPVACFVDGQADGGGSLEHLRAIERRVVDSGEAWISTTVLDADRPVLRACITSYLTEEQHLDALVDALNRSR